MTGRERTIDQWVLNAALMLTYSERGEQGVPGTRLNRHMRSFLGRSLTRNGRDRFGLIQAVRVLWRAHRV